MDDYKAAWRYDDRDTGGLYSLNHWPVTIVFDHETEHRTFQGENGAIHQSAATWRLVEVGSIGEAQVYLEERGYRPAGNRVCGYATAYTSDRGIARVTFAPACVYEFENDRAIRDAIDRDLDRYESRLLEELGPVAVDYEALHRLCEERNRKPKAEFKKL